MKLLVDMNLSPKWIAFLRDRGLEVVHWSSVGKANALDSEIMEYAATHNFVVVTHDLDFSAILAVTHGKRPSVVQIRSRDISMEAIGTWVAAALRHLERELDAGALVTIEADRTRVRLLPLRTE
jgi:predicted nuclease of predicted toxin-antitoxin system